MIGPQYDIMDIECGEKEDTQSMMRRLMKEKKEEMAREKEAASGAASAAASGAVAKGCCSGGKCNKMPGKILKDCRLSASKRTLAYD